MFNIPCSMSVGKHHIWTVVCLVYLASSFCSFCNTKHEECSQNKELKVYRIKQKKKTRKSIHPLSLTHALFQAQKQNSDLIYAFLFSFPPSFHLLLSLLLSFVCFFFSFFSSSVFFLFLPLFFFLYRAAGGWVPDDAASVAAVAVVDGEEEEEEEIVVWPVAATSDVVVVVWAVWAVVGTRPCLYSKKCMPARKPWSCFLLRYCWRGSAGRSTAEIAGLASCWKNPRFSNSSLPIRPLSILHSR